MQTENFTTTILKPEKGHYLTQSGDIDIRKRIIAETAVALGRNDSPENWIEIDEETANAYKEEQKAAFEADMKNSENVER